MQVLPRLHSQGPLTVHGAHLQTIAVPFEGRLSFPSELHSLRRLVSTKGAVQLSPGLKDRPSGPAPGLNPHTSHLLAPLSPMVRLQADGCEQQGTPACRFATPPHLILQEESVASQIAFVGQGLPICCSDLTSKHRPALPLSPEAHNAQAAKQVSIDQSSAAFALGHAGSQTGQKLGYLLLGRSAPN